MSETLMNIQYETTLDLIRYVLYFMIRRTDSVNPNQNHETFLKFHSFHPMNKVYFLYLSPSFWMKIKQIANKYGRNRHFSVDF